MSIAKARTCQKTEIETRTVSVRLDRRPQLRQPVVKMLGESWLSEQLIIVRVYFRQEVSEVQVCVNQRCELVNMPVVNQISTVFVVVSDQMFEFRKSFFGSEPICLGFWDEFVRVGCSPLSTPPTRIA